MTKDHFKRQSCKGIGPGGYHCSCCGPSPRQRKAHRRTTRRRLKQASLIKEVQ